MQGSTAPKSGARVGIVANPAAGRDIRRLVAQASVFPIAEKRNMITRAFSALGATGVEEVLVMPDGAGLTHRIVRAVRAPRLDGQTWPRIDFVDIEPDDTPEDTLKAASLMVEAGVGAIIVLGGDGTNRLVARVAGDVPLVSLSTGTNNVFPAVREATIAGLAAGLVATGQVPIEQACLRNKALRLEVNGAARDLALVDLCVSDELFVGAKALWRTDGLDQLFVSFAEAEAIGLSAIAGLLRPVSRRAPFGLRLDLCPPERAPQLVAAPIAPGIIVEVGVEAVVPLAAGEATPLRLARGVVALDGEREVEFSPADKVVVRLAQDGPLSVDIERTMMLAAQNGLFVRDRLATRGVGARTA
ncbi:MAG: ATP-NAD kinase family protein [Alphaproteobacteria bacterium]